jgi:hypothetical protein
VPVFRSHTTLEVARRKAFLNLDAGLVRGAVPRSEQASKRAQEQTRRGNRETKRLQERLSNMDQEVESIRQQLADRDQEIDRLRKLNHQQLVDKDQETAELYRQLHEAGPAHRANEEPDPRTASKDATAALYLDLMKRCLTDAIYDENRGRYAPRANPRIAHTLIGPERLDNLQFCVENALDNSVPGDFIETGVWRGGATIFMRAILKAYGVVDRSVWVADSFEGFPPPDAERYPHDAEDRSYTVNPKHIPSLEQVKANFERYELLDDQVCFLKGWFRDTLPRAPIEELAVARLDGDMYESTMDALVNLYPKLSVGGYLIVDDYGCFSACRQAVHDYRESHGITEDIQSIDWTGVYWQRLE